MLDIAENSVRAGASRVLLEVTDSQSADRLAFRIRDNGKGIDMRCKNTDSFFTSKEGKRFGLGIPLLAHAAELCDGSLEVAPLEEGGTEMRVEFRRSHIDLMPMGDVGATVAVLVGGHPDIDFDVVVIRDSGEFRFSTARLREELEGLPLNVPQVLEYIRQEIQEAFRRPDG
ncbi:MAG: ATP-binding protein [Thermodesulfovibrionales bacterium]|nr:ATP-binding protein [Thermodesulfovibrionales bacterium]